MLHNTAPMEYSGSLAYYNYHHQQQPHQHNNYNVQYARNGHNCPTYHSIASDTNFHHHSSHNPASFYQSPAKQQPYPNDKNSKYSAPAPDFNANVSSVKQNTLPDGSPPPQPAVSVSAACIDNHTVKPASTLPTFPWMNYSSEDGKRKRQSYSRRQTLELEKEFCYNQYLTKKRRSELCHMLQLSEKQIKTWFQNRRMKKKKEKQIDTAVVKSDDEIETFTDLDKSDSQDYAWNKTAVSSPVISIPEEGSLNQGPQFVQNPPHSHFYFNNPYQVNYT